MHHNFSRPELVQMCIELTLEWTSKSIQELYDSIKLECDRRFNNKKIHIGADNLSITLQRFLVEECGFIIKDRYGNKKTIKSW